ncbi:hypothetical protein FOZ61_005305 [Perkinsus olseni]|uniref:RNA methyltransferase n=1 Tax=Perkinsus olseni TaxID=32597 RepID=A0A7J6LI75_PEROL|nr:hypothetical protein FOZ61_005305 [Perkinsus olseni]
MAENSTSASLMDGAGHDDTITVVVPAEEVSSDTHAHDGNDAEFHQDDSIFIDTPATDDGLIFSPNTGLDTLPDALPVASDVVHPPVFTASKRPREERGRADDDGVASKRPRMEFSAGQGDYDDNIFNDFINNPAINDHMVPSTSTTFPPIAAEDSPPDQSLLPPPVFRSKRSIFEYGNYDRYYNYRHETRAFVDSRLSALMQYLGGDQLDFFHDKTVLDIGCNIGFVTFYVAYILGARRVVGVDIDHSLIDQALRQLRKYKHDGFPLNVVPTSSLSAHKSTSIGRRRAAALEPTFPIALTRRAGVPPITNKVLSIAEQHVENFVKPFGREKVEHVSDRFPFNIEFRTEDVSRDTVDIDVNDGSTITVASPCTHEKGKYDVIFLLSVIKWIHYHHGDEGVKHVFSKIYGLLKPGGLFIFEPQDWKSYRKKRNLTKEIRANFNSIELRPTQFVDYLEKEVGFVLECTLKPSPATATCDVRGFDRPIHLLRKPGGGAKGKQAPAAEIRSVGVYLHGFPDSGVRPVRCSGELQRKAEARFLPLTRADSPKVLHGSRMSSKMAEAVLSSTEGNDMAFCPFNTNGVPNSGGQFYDKTLVGDIEDLNAVCEWLKEHLPGLEKIFLLGFSTGAFLAVCAPVMASTLSEGLRSLLAGVISVACLDEPRSGAKLDFNQEQIDAFERTGECVTNFWPLVEVAIDEKDGSVINSHEIEGAPKPQPVEWRLSRGYYDSYGCLPEKEEISRLWPQHVPLLLVHGTADVLVPCEMSNNLQKAFGPECSVDRITTCEDGHLALCNECARQHRRARQTSSHQLLRLWKIPTCSTCDRAFDLDNEVWFCKTCDAAIGTCCIDSLHDGHSFCPITPSLAAKLQSRMTELGTEAADRELERGRENSEEILKLADELYEDQDARLTELEKDILTAVGERFKALRKLLRLQDEQVRSDIASVRAELARVSEARCLLSAAATETAKLQPREAVIAHNLIKNRKAEVADMTRRGEELCRLLRERQFKQFLDLGSSQDLVVKIANFGFVVPWKTMAVPESQRSPTPSDAPFDCHFSNHQPPLGATPSATTNHHSVRGFGRLHLKTDEEITRHGIGSLTGQIGDAAGGSGLGQFRSPYSVCNRPGRMFVSDSLNHRVQVFDTDTLELVYTIGQRGDAEGEFCDPSGIGVDSDGRIIVAEYGNDRVQIFDRDGKFLHCCGTFGSGEGEFYGPFGVHVCPATQNLLITDSCNHRVQVLSPRGRFLFAFGSKGSEPGQFLYPEGIGTTLDGSSVIVSDKDNGRIQIFTQRGVFIRQITTASERCGPLSGPLGVAADAQGRLYCCDCGNSRIVCLRITGEVLWCSDGSHEGLPVQQPSLTFAAPTGVVCAPPASVIRY